MATLTISTALASAITDSVTYRNAADSTYEYGLGSNFDYSLSTQNARREASNANERGSLLAYYTNGYFQQYINPVSILFKNSSNTTLVSYNADNITTRTMAVDGYCVLTNFSPITPANNGTIDYILITGNISRDITLSVGATGSGADVEFDDRTVVTTQPWRLDGTIKFRVPLSYTFST